jgi:putative membrane protein
MTNEADTSEKRVDASIGLAADRTGLAYDRTLLAYTRTTITLITFGFTIYKFFQLELARAQPRPERLFGPTHFALLMIVIGLGSLVFATLEHRREMKALRARYPGNQRTLSRALAALVSLLGIVALLAVVLRQ